MPESGRNHERKQGDSSHENDRDSTIGAHEHGQEPIEKSALRDRALVEQSLGLICTHDLKGTLLYINPAAAQSLGYQPGHGIGHNLSEFLAPDTRPLFDAYLRRISEAGQDAGLMRVASRDGSERVWMYRNVLYAEPGASPFVLGHALDITDRVAAERALRYQEQALRAMHAELDDRVRERTTELERANERLRIEIAERERAELAREQMLVKQRDTLAFMASVSEYFAPILTFEQLVEILRTSLVPFAAEWTAIHIVDDDRRIHSVAGAHRDSTHEPVLASFAAAASGILPETSDVARAIASGELTIVKGTPGDLPVRLVGPGEAARQLARLQVRNAAIIPLAVDGVVKAAVLLGSASDDQFGASGALIIEDLLPRIRLALDRIQLYREAQEASRLKDEFLSTLSHELRTPLNAIFGWTRILRTRPMESSTEHAVRVIERNADALIRLIDDVLDVSRIITGKMTLTMEPVDVGLVLRAAVESLRPDIEAKGIRLEESVSPDIPPVVADAHRLQQLFWNLLSNALKFTGSEGSIRLGLSSTGGFVRCEISDTGVGIRRDVLPFVFDRFRQADASITRTYGGLGLGLAIVRHIAEMHDGTVTVESAGEGHGATFTIELPADLPEPETGGAVQGTVADGKGRSGPLGGCTVMVVEDHDDARELLVSVLEAAGARVISAAASGEALRRMASITPDVLVIDIGLPGEDGYTLLGRIRALHRERDRSLPAVALTAYARASDRARALSAGFQHHIVKPVDPQKLVETIASLRHRDAP